MSRLTDAELSRAVQNRDEAAMETIINRYSRLLWRVCAAVLSKSGGTQDVEECVADAFVYLWRYPERYDSSRSTLKTFLCMVARSRAMDRYRSLARSRTVSLEETLAEQTLDAGYQRAGVVPGYAQGADCRPAYLARGGAGDADPAVSE